MAAHGNDQVILALEMLLAEARLGQHGYLVACMAGHGARPIGLWCGTASLEAKGAVTLKQMTVDFDAERLNKTVPVHDACAPADRVCYNIPMSPMSYDFIPWLIDAEMVRRIEGAPAPLKVCFWQGRDGQTGLDKPGRRQMFMHVVRPMLDLVGAVEDESAIDGRVRPIFSSRDIVARARAGFEVPMFRAPEDKRRIMADRHRRPVTITLREAASYPYRNSNLAAWLKFAAYLKASGENVVFVRDTARAHEPIEGFEICPVASMNLGWRMALYETAKMNLFVSNGPATLGHFGNFPWMMFLKPEDDDYAYEPNTPKFWREQIGVEMGGQFPWSRPDQRIVWRADDYDSLMQAWRVMQVTHGVLVA